MSQVDVDTSIGYALKRATSALRSAMDECLRDLDITVSQYSSLELLAHKPGLSNAELARAVFVSRQATHQLLAGLTRGGLVEIEGVGRDQRLYVTTLGRERLRQASAAVAAVENAMIASLSKSEREVLHRSLVTCAAALDGREQS
ncbi:MarR family transcriptional regulator [Rhodococcus sp. NKCM2511]|uniref:MarR family winged helix-turn-helix transcriptional regulator n=1 Tax=Rhodococcus sp. NKCM2511 TaxID=2766011 RepID=UPI00191053E1|nr:MarR family transcriptional regulator [Rhodococcus sp. NKCM2511]GHP17834.1 MarR family transcriptional regulator [Rhodococcus sp. NKCM2511]